MELISLNGASYASDNKPVRPFPVISSANTEVYDGSPFSLLVANKEKQKRY